MSLSGLNPVQVAALLEPIKQNRVMFANGQSHVPAYDVAAHLTRILGFGNWDTDLLSTTLLFEDGGKEGKRWTVGYSATVRLTIKDQYGFALAHWENGAAGDAVNQPSRADAHHLALTTAISTALKRCAAFGLGDQFGLSLYNKGSLGPLLKRTLVGNLEEPTGRTDLQSDVPTPQSLGNDEREAHEEPSDEGVSAPAAAPAPAPFTELQQAIKDHPRYKAMSGPERGQMLSDIAGYPVKSLRDVDEALCVGILLSLNAPGGAE